MIQYNQPISLVYVKLKRADRRVYVCRLHAFRYQVQTKIMFLVRFIKGVLVRIRTRAAKMRVQCPYHWTKLFLIKMCLCQT